MNEQADRETRSIKTHVFMSAGRWEKMKRGNRWSAIGVKWAAPRREWNGKNDGGETLFIRGWCTRGCLVAWVLVARGGNGATNTHTAHAHTHNGRRILLLCVPGEIRRRRKRKAKGNPQEMSSFLLNIPRTTAQGNWLARSETNWIRSSSSSSIEFRIPIPPLCQTTLFQSSVATLGLRFNDTNVRTEYLGACFFPFFSQKFLRQFLPVKISSEFARS